MTARHLPSFHGGRPIAELKRKGDRAELEVARDLSRRGYRLAFPHGEDWDFDLIFSRDGLRLERVQVKYATARNGVIPVRTCSHSLTNGRVRRTKRYTTETIDWIGVYDSVTDRCYYVPATALGSGMRVLSLRIRDTGNGQRSGVRYARDYRNPYPLPEAVLPG